nr:hypothetical protein Iba_chr12fCG2350 [Ipomoea batatas]
MKVRLNNKPPDLAAVVCPVSCCSASDVESEECKLERDNSSRVRPSISDKTDIPGTISREQFPEFSSFLGHEKTSIENKADAPNSAFPFASELTESLTGASDDTAFSVVLVAFCPFLFFPLFDFPAISNPCIKKCTTIAQRA